MTFKALILLSVASVLAAACSVKNEFAENKPPVIHKDLVSFSTTYGAYQFALPPSAFLYPVGLNEDQVAEFVLQLKTRANQADDYLTKNGNLQAQLSALKSTWDNGDCVTKYAVLGPDDDPTIGVDHVSQWQDAKDANEAVEIANCQQNQSQREKIPPEVVANNVAFSDLITQINLLIDPDQTNLVNTRAISQSGTTLSIDRDDAGAVSVHVKLADFVVTGYSPSTDESVTGVGTDPRGILNASYNEGIRSLRFDVPECTQVISEPVPGQDPPQVKKTYVYSGNVYRFVLERGPNLGPALAKFSGDMNLYDASGKLLRYGTANVYATPPR